LRVLKAGSRVNLEIDLIARYVERMLTAPPIDQKASA
jgi:riboflavin synthase